MKKRIRISPEGVIQLSEKLREELGWTTGSYLEYKVSGNKLELWRVEVDLFAEAMKKPDQDAFDKILKQQSESQTRAFSDFEKKLKEPLPDLRPEDRPEFWD